MNGIEKKETAKYSAVETNEPRTTAFKTPLFSGLFIELSPKYTTYFIKFDFTAEFQ